MTDFPLLTPFREQMEVDVRFKIPANPPTAGANVLNLMKDDNNIMIHCRVDANQLLLSTRKNGTWLSGTRVEIPYPGLGSAGNVVTLRVQARPDHFYVTINGDDGHKYPYQLPYTDIIKGRVGSGLEYFVVFPHL